jgi:GNAT superfamily N-acetyltransferase/SAM-dependent methyltransferase
LISEPHFAKGRANAWQIEQHLRACDSQFVPPLSARVDLVAYARKLAERSSSFEAWSEGELVGLVATYFGAERGSEAHISNVSVLPQWTGQGIASALLNQCIEGAKLAHQGSIKLEVSADNSAAVRLYTGAGFVIRSTLGTICAMQLMLQEREAMNQKRDYDVEIRDNVGRLYAYSFDFDVMHPYMIRSFAPFFRPGSLLELGSFKGDFTQRFLPFFEDITCVEASGEALAEARSRLGEQVKLVEAMFETVRLPRQYDNIVLTHVLEHLDDPVKVLRRVNEEWLAEGGRFFLVCPNANAPSRQIAVKMGLISHNAAVTPAEAAHGHRITYSLDTLERDAVAAGLNVMHRSGVFFKALANFQWDRLLKTDIVSKEYLDGCYQLGQQYPELCSSIFLLCERGTGK